MYIGTHGKLVVDVLQITQRLIITICHYTRHFICNGLFEPSTMGWRTLGLNLQWTGVPTRSSQKSSAKHLINQDISTGLMARRRIQHFSKGIYLYNQTQLPCINTKVAHFLCVVSLTQGHLTWVNWGRMKTEYSLYDL